MEAGLEQSRGHIFTLIRFSPSADEPNRYKFKTLRDCERVLARDTDTAWTHRLAIGPTPPDMEVKAPIINFVTGSYTVSFAALLMYPEVDIHLRVFAPNDIITDRKLAIARLEGESLGLSARKIINPLYRYITEEYREYSLPPILYIK